jgi:hypothetical protein
MTNLSPKIILPIVALIIMMVQEATGLKFGEAELQIINDAILSIIALSGIFVNPNKDSGNSE